MRNPQDNGPRNAAVAVATAATVAVLFFYPTSTNRGDTQRKPGQAVAPAGVVTPSPGATKGPTASAAAAAVVVNGASADTQYGPVQVQLTIRGSRIVSAVAIDYPQSGGRDREINSIAIPLLEHETLAAQSSQIDSVSGATYTSDGYLQSLQSALDAAQLH